MSEVRIACLCPPKPSGEARHPDGDTVNLKDPLDFRTATIIRKSIGWQRAEDPDATVPELLAMLTELYLIHGIESWTLVDAKGRPLPVSKANIREYLLPFEEAITVADAADTLYTERVILPLVAQASTSSASTPTDGSTSATNGTGTTPQKPSKQSSTSITQTAGTAVMTG